MLVNSRKAYNADEKWNATLKKEINQWDRRGKEEFHTICKSKEKEKSTLKVKDDKMMGLVGTRQRNIMEHQESWARAGGAECAKVLPEPKFKRENNPLELL